MKRFIFKILYFTTLTFCGYFTITYAQDYSFLYSAQIEVPERTTEQVATKLPNMLEKILIRISLNNNIMQNTNIYNAVLSRANNFLQSYKFISINNKIFLKINFYPRAVDKLLQNNNQIIYHHTKSSTLLWVAIKDDTGTRLLTQGEDNDLLAKTTQAADIFAIPISFPFLDTQDLKFVNFNTVWLPLISILKYASARYNCTNFAILDIDETNKTNINARWFLLHNDLQFDWSDAGSGLQNIIYSGVSKIGSHLLKNITTNGKDNQEIIFIANNINSLQNYQNIITFLKSVSGIIDFKLQNLNNDKAKFLIIFNTSLTNLKNKITKSNFLKLNVELSAYNAHNTLYYDYIG